MASRILTCLGETTSKCIYSNVQLHQSRVHIQTSWRHARGFKRNKKVAEATESIISTEYGIPLTPLDPSKLWRAFGFTVTFSGISFATASILEYERKRKNFNRMFGFHGIVERDQFALWRQNIRHLWTSLSEGQRVFVPILFLNTVVFLGWKIPALRGTMLKYFTANPAARNYCWPMLLSTFSHSSAIHLGINMFVLHSFISPAVQALGKEQFVAVYLAGGLFSSFASNFYKIMFSIPGLSLGASGSIMGIVAIICTRFPDTTLCIAFLPMIKFTAGSAIKGLIAMDLTGCILRWRLFDHAAHLGGALFGIYWGLWGHSDVWKNRNFVQRYWHKIRQPSEEK